MLHSALQKREAAKHSPHDTFSRRRSPLRSGTEKNGEISAVLLAVKYFHILCAGRNDSARWAERTRLSEAAPPVSPPVFVFSKELFSALVFSGGATLAGDSASQANCLGPVLATVADQGRSQGGASGRGLSRVPGRWRRLLEVVQKGICKSGTQQLLYFPLPPPPAADGVCLVYQGQLLFSVARGVIKTFAVTSRSGSHSKTLGFVAGSVCLFVFHPRLIFSGLSPLCSAAHSRKDWQPFLADIRFQCTLLNLAEATAFSQFSRSTQLCLR